MPYPNILKSPINAKKIHQRNLVPVSTYPDLPDVKLDPSTDRLILVSYLIFNICDLIYNFIKTESQTNNFGSSNILETLLFHWLSLL